MGSLNLRFEPPKLRDCAELTNTRIPKFLDAAGYGNVLLFKSCSIPLDPEASNTDTAQYTPHSLPDVCVFNYVIWMITAEMSTDHSQNGGPVGLHN